MQNPFFIKSPYHNFSLQHGAAVLVFLFFAFAIIRYARRQDKQKQILIGSVLSLIPLLALLFRMFLEWRYYEFTAKDDLPFHLCRILTFVAPFMMFRRSQKLFDVLYYLILVGVANAIITAEIDYGFPHHDYFLYWLIHEGLLLLPIYAIFVYGFRPSLRGIWKALIAINIYLLLMLFINALTGGNYLYASHKPDVPTLIDYLGDWPYYLLSLEIIMVLMSLLVYLPFLKSAKRT